MAPLPTALRLEGGFDLAYKLGKRGPDACADGLQDNPIPCDHERVKAVLAESDGFRAFLEPGTDAIC